MPNATPLTELVKRRGAYGMVAPIPTAASGRTVAFQSPVGFPSARRETHLTNIRTLAYYRRLGFPSALAMPAGTAGLKPRRCKTMRIELKPWFCVLAGGYVVAALLIGE
jgi:hypothetical protein